MNASDDQDRLKRAVTALRDMRERFESLKAAQAAPVAIVGMGCRFPGGADSPAAFWRLLEEGRDTVREVPEDRWPSEAFYASDADAEGRMNTRWGAFLDDIRGFDPEFFGITRREAARMDPQQRLAMEVATEALEDAAIPIGSLAGSATGAFIGVHSQSNDYQLLQLRSPGTIDVHTGTGTAHSIIANRLSYWLDLQGPSLTVDTACSSSLVAIHLAVMSLRARESDLALAGGTNLILTPEPSVAFAKMRLFSPEGRCKTFDASADGLVRGEGCGVVVLKRLEDALADGDRVRAVIVGSAVNQDGRSNGLTAPNGLSQQRVIRRALDNGGVDPAEVSFVETHGTGTFLGDPIEVEALGEVLGLAGEAPCTLGAVKTNIGHLEGAAGVAGLIKAVLALEHRSIPPNLHLEQVNPHVALDGNRLRLPQGLEAWDPPGRRVAGVSSFGFGGTNAHLVVTSAPTHVSEQSPEAEPGPWILPLSASSEAALSELSEAYARFLPTSTAPLGDVAATAATGRSHQAHRLAVVGGDRDQLVQALRDTADRDVDRVVAFCDDEAPPRRIAFLYSGQGGQHPAMAPSLLDSNAAFRAAVEACDETFEPLAGWSLVERLGDLSEELLERTSVAQPLLFAMQVGLTEALRDRGFEPSAVVGHSVGEIAAAWAVGALTLEDAVRVVFHRGDLIERMAGPGRMAVIGLPREDVEALEGARSGLFSVAAVNGPRSTVISGECEAVDEVIDRLEGDEVFVRRLFMPHAFHGPPMEPVRTEFVRVLADVKPSAARVPFHSSVTGTALDGSALDAEYWGRNLREPVDYPAAVQSVVADDLDFVEIGPHALLEIPTARVLGLSDSDAVIPSQRRDVEPRRALHHATAALHVRGHEVRWSALYPERRTPVDLPLYPFQRVPLWVEGTAAPWASPTLPDSMDASGDSADVPEDWLYRVEWQLREPAGRPPDPFDAPGPSHLLPGAPDDLGLTEAEAAAHELPARLDDLALASTASAIRALDWSLTVGDRILDSGLDERQYPRHRRRLVERLLGILAEEGIVRRDGDGWLVERDAPASMDVDGALRDLARAHPDHVEILELVRRCLPRVADVVRGVTDPLDLLFPSGSTSDLRTLYEESPLSRLANEAAGRALVELREAGCTRSLRVLEVGGGTGGTTARLIPELDPRSTDYVFTDISRAFLTAAESEFDSFTGFRTARLDLEEEEGSDDATVGPFDLCVAANVLHATADIRSSLDALHERLVPGGLLLLVEGTAPARWVDLTFGLTEGWWRFEDVDLRPNHPLLTNASWSATLEAAGFDDVRIVTIDGATTGSGFTQSVILARKDPAAVSESRAPIPSSDRRWMVLHPGDDMGRAAAAALATLPGGAELAVDDVDGLRAWLAAPDAGSAGVVLLSSASPPSVETDADTLLTEIAARHQSAVAVAQAVIDAAGTRARLWMVTSNAQAVGSGAHPDPTQAALWGLGRVVALENPPSWGGLIDLSSDVTPEALPGLLLPHLAEGSGEDQVAFHRGARWVARMAPSAQVLGDPVELREDGTYLVIGGLGRLGRLFAPWLAERGAGKLVLAGRTPLPPRDEWDALPPDSDVALKVAAVRAAEAAGAEVVSASVDVSDRASVKSLLESLEADGSTVRGIFHAASFTEFVPSLGAERKAVEATLRSKVVGSWILHSLVAELDLELDHFVLFSSVASLLGSRAVGAYAAANQFLDALVHMRRSEGLPGVASVWGGWAGGPDSERALLEMNHLVPLRPGPARDALGRLMTSSAEVVAVAHVDWPALDRDYQLGGPRRFLDEIPVSRTTDEATTAALSGSQRLQVLAPEEARRRLLEQVRITVAEVIGLGGQEALAPDQGFFRLGMDSLMTVELRGRLQRELQIDLPATIALEYPTAERLTDYLAELLGFTSGPDEATPGGSSRAPERSDADFAADLSELGEDELAEQLDDALARILEEDQPG